MKQSSLTAYYTDPLLISEMWNKLEPDGFTGGKILDPRWGLGISLRPCPLTSKEIVSSMV